MKFIFIITAVLILGGITFLLTNTTTQAPAAVEIEKTFAPDTPLNGISDIETTDEVKVPDIEESNVTEEDITVQEESKTSSLEPATTEKVFTVSGGNFAFDVTNVTVNEGDTVTINFESSSGFHDWVVDEFDAATKQVQPGTPTSVTFVADKKGSFEYYCSVGQHRAAGMIGTLIVK